MSIILKLCDCARRKKPATYAITSSIALVMLQSRARKRCGYRRRRRERDRRDRRDRRTPGRNGECLHAARCNVCSLPLAASFPAS